MGGGGSKPEAKEIGSTISSIINEINSYTYDDNIETFTNGNDRIYIIIGFILLAIILFIHVHSRKK